MDFKKSFNQFSRTKDKDSFLINFAITSNLEIKDESILGKVIGKGAYGATFSKKNNSKNCIKLIDSGISKDAFNRKEHFDGEYFGNYAEAKCIKNIVSAYLEAFYLYKSRVTKITPKFYRIFFVKYNGKVYPAIEMERIAGVPLHSVKNLWGKKTNRNLFVKNNKISVKKDGQTIQSYIKNKMFLAKLEHMDSHWGNIFLNPKTNEIRIIDFSSEYIKYKVNDRFKFFRLYISKCKVVFTKQDRLRKYSVKFRRGSL